MSEQTYSCTVSEQPENYSRTLLVSASLFLLAAVLLGLISFQVENTVLRTVTGLLAVPFAASAALACWAWRNGR